MKLILGTANFLTKYGLDRASLNSEQIYKIFNICETKNIFDIDTAQSYDHFLKLKKIKFCNYKINTKISLEVKQINKKNYLVEKKMQIKKSIEKYGIIKYHSILIHNFYDFKKKEDFKIIDTFLEEIKNEGLTDHVGASLYEVNELKKINFFHSIDILQIPMNLINRSFTIKDLLELKKKNILIYARSIFLQGLLLKDIKNLRINFSRHIVFKKLEIWHKNNDISKLEGCLSYLKSFNI